MPPPTRSTLSEINRVFWRLVLFAIVAAGVVMMMGVVLKPVFPTGLPFGREGQTLFLLVVALALGIAHLAAAFWEKSGDWEILGFAPEGWQPKRLLLATAGGVLLALVAVGVLLAAGWAAFTTLPAGSLVGYAGNAFLVVGLATLVEGLAFRGYLFGLVERRWGAWAAVVVSGLLFALMHTRSGAPSIVTLVAVLALGVFLGAVRARAAGVAAPWLAHASFVWVQAGVVHSAVTGVEIEVPPNYSLALGEPALMSGRGWGIEGGAVAAVLLFLAAALLMRAVPLRPLPPARP